MYQITWHEFFLANRYVMFMKNIFYPCLCGDYFASQTLYSNVIKLVCVCDKSLIGEFVFFTPAPNSCGLVTGKRLDDYFPKSHNTLSRPT